MEQVNVSAPGKIILLGEHVVVYGKPAIIATVDRRAFVKLTPRSDGTIEIVAENFKQRQNFSKLEIIGITKKANIDWKQYGRTNDIDLLKSITKNPLDYVAIIIGETLSYFHKRLQTGFSLSINSEIPIGSGLGSSAALAVSIVAAVSLLLGEKWNLEKINEIAFLAEEKRHGRPSGSDTSSSCYGGLILYRLETSNRKVIKPLDFSIPSSIADNFVLIDSGKPIESTGEMVGAVAAFKRQKQKFVESIFNDQEKLTKQLVPVLKNGNEDEILSIIRRGEANLEQIGVVSPFVKSLIREIENLDGAAKICGAGGRIMGAGMLLAYHKNKSELMELLQNKKITFSFIELGAGGVRREL